MLAYKAFVSYISFFVSLKLLTGQLSGGDVTEIHLGDSESAFHRRIVESKVVLHRGEKIRDRFNSPQSVNRSPWNDHFAGMKSKKIFCLDMLPD